jgi:hypothetical protein
VREHRKEFILAAIRIPKSGVGQRAGRHIHAFDKYSRDAAIPVLDRLVDEIHIARDHRSAGFDLDGVGSGGREKCIATRVHLVEQIKVSLFDCLGQRLCQGAADYGPMADEPHISRVRKLDNMRGSAQHRHERRGLLE